jgi:hypothetical protein
VTPKAPPRDPWRAVLLSALFFPGLGQWASGHPWRAVAFGLSSIALLAAVVQRVVRETQRLMPEDPAAILDLTLPVRLAIQVHRDNASFFFWATLGIVVIWLASIADAWACGRSARP